ncbi:MAG: DUF4097 family beta strand repeat-containing protein [Chloroflexota bacterium]
MTQTFTVSENARVQIRACRNRVTIAGWDDARAVSVDQPARQDGDTIIIEGVTKVNVRVPRHAAITIDDCPADVRVEDLAGKIELANIRGDVALRNLRGETRARAIDGDLIARQVAALKGEGKWDGDAALYEVKNFQADEIEGDLVLRGADAATIRQVEGDAVLERVARAQINEIEGDAHLDSVGAATIQVLKGDLAARGVRDALSIENAEGDVNLRDARGRVAIAKIEGDFIASSAQGALDVPQIEGDAVISFEQVAELNLRAEGDVVLNLPRDANAELRVDAPAGNIVVRADMKATSEDENHLHGTLGSGGVTLRVESMNGDVIVRGGGVGEHRRHREHRHHREYYRQYAQQYAEMGRRIAKEVRQSVHASLAEAGIHEHRRKHHWRIGIGIAADDAPREEPVAEKPRGPAAGSPERQAILDAIARGELNVDDAIKKLRGEM